VLNDVSREGVGFDSDRNAVTFLTRDRSIELPEMTKRELADHLLDEILALRRPRHLLAEADTGLSIAPGDCRLRPGSLLKLKRQCARASHIFAIWASSTSIAGIARR